MRKQLLLILLVGLLASACGNDDESVTPSTDGGAEEATVQDLGATLTYADRAGPSSFDPVRSTTSHDASSLRLAYDRLIHRDPSGEFVPGLATSWEFLPGEDAFRMELREGVTFHDGAVLDAEAVVANFERALTLEDSARASELAAVGEAVVVDDMTVDLMLTGPAAALPALLSDRAGMMVSPDAFDNPDLGRIPVGAGMFEVTDHQPGVSISYGAFTDYWEPDAVGVGGIEYMIMQDQNARANALTSGAVDVAMLDEATVDGVEGTADIDITISEDPGANFLMFLDKSESPLDDVRVRQAINYAIDREAIVETVLFGYGNATAQPFGEGSIAHVESLEDAYPYDPEMARELLADSGYADGVRIEFVVPSISFYGPIHEAVQSYLSEVGIELVGQTVEVSASASTCFVELVGAGCYGSWSARPDESITINQLFTETGNANPGKWAPPEMQDLYTASVSVLDEDERAEAMREISTLAVEEALDVFLFRQVVPYGISSRVTGFEQWLNEGRLVEFRGVALREE